MNSVKALIFTHAAYLTTKNLSLLCLYVNSRVQIFCFLKMAENINQKHSRKKKKRLPYKPERGTKSQTIPGHNVAENQNMINTGLLHICRL